MKPNDRLLFEVRAAPRSKGGPEELHSAIETVCAAGGVATSEIVNGQPQTVISMRAEDIEVSVEAHPYWYNDHLYRGAEASERAEIVEQLTDIAAKAASFQSAWRNWTGGRGRRWLRY